MAEGAGVARKTTSKAVVPPMVNKHAKKAIQGSNHDKTAQLSGVAAADSAVGGPTVGTPIVANRSGKTKAAGTVPSRNVDTADPTRTGLKRSNAGGGGDAMVGKRELRPATAKPVARVVARTSAASEVSGAHSVANPLAALSPRKAKAVPTKTAPAKTAPAKTATGKTATAKTATAKTASKTVPAKTSTNLTPASGSGSHAVPLDADRAPTIAARTAAKGATMAKPVDTEATASGTTTVTRAPAAKQGGRTATKVAPRTERSPAETEKIRVALSERLAELSTEYGETITEITELQRDRLTDSAGDDQADTGTKTFEREQEMTLAANLLERVTQVERALERLDEGGYGWCERCGNPIPVERLAAFPSATLCVTCKQLEERR
jgi:RNA polymerase-binding transcription factor